MGRWRPPQPSSSPYITPDGAKALQAELTSLWRSERPVVVSALKAAAAEGDRSENAEYIYRKKQLAEIDRRIRYLDKRIKVMKVVRDKPRQSDQVFFSAWVTLQQSGRETVEYRIVGADEIDAKRHWISIDSPLARALLGQEMGATVQVQLPSGPDSFRIIAVRYK